MKDKMLALVAPYFGKLPAHFQLWLNSCAMNPQVTWLLYTDDRTPWEYPDNVEVTYCSLSDLRERFQRKLGIAVALESPRKLCDFKPMYGYLFEDELEAYQAWGYCDPTDTINGDYSRFIDLKLINSYDRLGYLGHLTIYRNTDVNNRRFMADTCEGRTWEKCASNPNICIFDEPAPLGIDDIWHHNGWSTGFLDESIADLTSYSWHFRIAKGYADAHTWENNRCLVFEWNNGRLYGHELDRSGMATREFLYVHFKRRRMDIDDNLDPNQFLIAPRGFVAYPRTLTPDCLKGLGKRRFPDPLWLSTKWANLKARLAAV